MLNQMCDGIRPISARVQLSNSIPGRREIEWLGIFGNGSNPVGTYQQFAWNLGQTILRSESESHFLPADWPTFAQLDAVLEALDGRWGAAGRSAVDQLRRALRRG